VQGGKCRCAFTGKIVLVPDALAAPLKDRVPKRIFPNSRSDLFHEDVPDEYIDMVFTVMEVAWWHTFLVLTKRPERMAEYTQRRYKDKEPPKNICCGTSVEDQKSYDERIVHLRKVKSAVLWLSVEPFIGKIKFGDLSGIRWMVVGGESGSDRKMEEEWAIEARDECKKFNIPFFFKQWGSFNEEGEKVGRKAKKDPLIPATLDGIVFNAFPEMSVPSGGSKPK
jgi:protein gp37